MDSAPPHSFIKQKSSPLCCIELFATPSDKENGRSNDPAKKKPFARRNILPISTSSPSLPKPKEGTQYTKRKVFTLLQEETDSKKRKAMSQEILEKELVPIKKS